MEETGCDFRRIVMNIQFSRAATRGAAVVRHVCRMAIMSAMFLTAPLASAHELQPAIVDVVVARDGGIALTVKTNLEAFLAGIGAEHDDTDDAPTAAEYERLRALAPEALQAAGEAAAKPLTDALDLQVDGAPLDLALTTVAAEPVGDVSQARRTSLGFSGRAPSGAAAFVWRNESRFGDAAVRVRRDGEDTPYFGALVPAGAPSDAVGLDIDARQGMGAVFVNYVVSGFDHIVPKGLDHILFVVGLFLLSAKLGPLLWQVTSFTIAHSITLALGALGVVQISPDIVEPLIAASIVYVAVENLMTDRLKLWRPAIVFGFGLLHGLGFAGVLAEFGMPDGHFLTALFAFNIGVELGQLAVVAACFAVVGYWFGAKPWYRRVVVWPASLAIACIAAFWFLERTALI